MYSNFKFDITNWATNSAARCGIIQTPHGIIETPAFIFCATKATIKGLTPKQVQDANTQVILSNTYHLMLQPTANIVQKLGGLHKMMNWNKPLLTDSGGYQIFSLGHGSVANEIKGKRQSVRPKTLLKITEEGARFRSYIDGKLHNLTPESSITIQQQLGADLILVLDECTPFHVDKDYTRNSMEMSHRWAVRSLKQFISINNNQQALYGIIQGGIYPDLRRISSEFVNDQYFFGHAIGGSLGASKAQMHEIVAITAELLRKDRPIHLLGIGGIRDIFNGVEQGIDTFDCVHPTRLARHGGALVKANTLGSEQITGKEHLNIRNTRYLTDERPIEQDCNCETCQSFSRGYIHHLFRAKEILAMQALTIHNVYFINQLMMKIKEAIKINNLNAIKKDWLLD